jgi:PPOX class probable F420-dependent enzyme
MNRREQIEMTASELRAFLEEQRTLIVSSNGPDGYPHVVPMWYTLVNGDLAFWTYSKAQKTVNLRRDPRITCLLEAGDTYGELRGAQIKGTAVLDDDEATALRVGIALHERNYGGSLTPELRRKVERQATKRTVVVVKALRVASWDHRKLSGEY